MQMLSQRVLFSVVVFLDARKKKKKDHDKTWKHEERRGSGEHRRSGGFHNARRGSGSRQRDWRDEDSDEGSLPPSLSDGQILIFIFFAYAYQWISG